MTKLISKPQEQSTFAKRSRVLSQSAVERSRKARSSALAELGRVLSQGLVERSRRAWLSAFTKRGRVLSQGGYKPFFAVTSPTNQAFLKNFPKIPWLLRYLVIWYTSRYEVLHIAKYLKFSVLGGKKRKVSKKTARVNQKFNRFTPKINRFVPKTNRFISKMIALCLKPTISYQKWLLCA